MTSLYWDGAKRYHEAIKRGGRGIPVLGSSCIIGDGRENVLGYAARDWTVEKTGEFVTRMDFGLSCVHCLGAPLRRDC